MINAQNVEVVTLPDDMEFGEAPYIVRLNAVNQTLRFTSIRGKEYAEVNQRVLAFWSLFPHGRIITKITSDTGSRCDVEALVYRDAADYEPATTGHAFEVKQGAINNTSYLENCETSAIGRALGFLGIGANTAIASAEEVLNAISQQAQAQNGQQAAPTETRPQKRSQKAADPIIELVKQCTQAGIKPDGLQEHFKVHYGIESLKAPGALNALDERQRKEVTGYLRQLLTDKQALQERQAADSGQ